MASDDQRRLVREMAGSPARVIAAAVGCSIPTLRKAFREEMAARGGPWLFDAVAAPAEPRRGREGAGRKPFQPAPWQREEVETFTACGMSRGEIALALGVSEPTLAKHFALELAAGEARTKARMIRALHRASAKGSVSALKEMRAMIDAAIVARAGEAIDQGAEAVRGETPGKKAQAKLDAASALDGGAWADLMRPH